MGQCEAKQTKNCGKAPGMAVLNKVALRFKERFWPDICGFNRVPMQQVGVGWPSNFGISVGAVGAGGTKV